MEINIEKMESITKLRFGILGCADIARKNIRAIKASTNCQIVAIASRLIDKANKYCIDNEIEDAITFGNYDDLLLSDIIDAVYIPLPTSLHLEYAIKACNNKKHVLLEKPCALNSNELKQIIDAANLNNVLFMDGVMFMHHNRLESLMKSFHQEHLKVSRVNSSFAFNGNDEFLNSNIRNDPSCDPLGSLGDLGWYCIRLGIIAFERDYIPYSSISKCYAWGSDGKIPLDCVVDVTFKSNNKSNDKVSNKPCILHFDCSFLDSFRQRFEVYTVSHDHSKSGDVIITCDDFVIPRVESSASYQVETMDSIGPLVDKSTRVASSLETFTSICHQEKEMFDKFAYIVANINNEESNEKRDEAHKLIKYYQNISMKTQCILDACLLSMQENGKEIIIDLLSV